MISHYVAGAGKEIKGIEKVEKTMIGNGLRLFGPNFLIQVLPSGDPFILHIVIS
jgi:hypothetical protein